MNEHTENSDYKPPIKKKLSELGKFIRGSTGGQKVDHSELSECAMDLIAVIPSTRGAVLDYLYNLFDEAANLSLCQSDSTPGAKAESSFSLDLVIDKVSEKLLDLIRNMAEPWAPIISSWSLDLLGHISTKYRERIHIPELHSLNQVLHIWLSCTSAKQLIDIALECFSTMITSSSEVCVDWLLETSVKYSPYFDWVVAHIGSCFPGTIITRVLSLGLKDFCLHMSMSVDDTSSKMASVVGILGHLAARHGQCIRDALISLFRDSLEPSDDHVHISTVSFLLQLASKSPLLHRILTTDCLTILTPDVLNTLHEQFKNWGDISDFHSLCGLAVHLIMTSDTASNELFQFLLNIAAPKTKCDNIKDGVRETAEKLLDQLCVDLQRAAYNRHSNTLDIPFLSSMSKHLSELTADLLTSDNKKAVWGSSIITSCSIYSGESCAAHILQLILLHSSDVSQLQHFIDLQTSMESVFPHVIRQTLNLLTNQITDQLESSFNIRQVLTNVLSLIVLEKSTLATSTSSIRRPLSPEVQTHIGCFSTFLTHPNLEIAILAARIIHEVSIDMRCPRDTLVSVFSSVCIFLFDIFACEDSQLSIEAFYWIRQLVENLRIFNLAHSCLATLLLETALKSIYAETLGGTFTSDIAETSVNGDKQLLLENRSHGLSLTLPESRFSVFHAGIISRRKKILDQHFSDDVTFRNRSYFINILSMCTTIAKTENQENDSKADPFFHENERGRKIAEHLTDILTPDALYNSILWPEEECVQLTIERDLHVKKLFDFNPILWDVLDIFSTNQAFVCYLSPILRSLMATVINYFDSSKHITPSNTSAYISSARAVIYSLRKGGQLPPPLCNIGEILPFITHHEIFLLLVNIWKYVKENPPKIDNGGKRKGCDSKYTDIIRSTLQKNIATLGSHYCSFVSSLSHI